MPRRSKLKPALPTVPNAGIDELRKQIEKAVAAQSFKDPQTGKIVKGDVIAALARIGHDPATRPVDACRALGMLLDRMNPSLATEPKTVVQVNNQMKIIYDWGEDEHERPVSAYIPVNNEEE